MMKQIRLFHVDHLVHQVNTQLGSCVINHILSCMKHFITSIIFYNLNITLMLYGTQLRFTSKLPSNPSVCTCTKHLPCELIIVNCLISLSSYMYSHNNQLILIIFLRCNPLIYIIFICIIIHNYLNVLKVQSYRRRMMFYSERGQTCFQLSQLQPTKVWIKKCIVQSTCSMQSTLKLGGLGACLIPRKILKIACLEIDSSDILHTRKS